MPSIAHTTKSRTATPKPRTSRGRVLDVALQLFSTRGFFNTTVHDIARDAEVSIGSIYHHFQDKEAIGRALFDQLVLRMTGALDAITKTHTTAHDRCRAVVELLFKLAEEEPALMAYMLHTQHQEFMPGQAPVCSSRPFTQMRAMVAAGMETGEIRPMDSLVAATTLFGGPLRMISLRLDKILEIPLQRYTNQVWDASWRAIAT